MSKLGLKEAKPRHSSPLIPDTLPEETVRMARAAFPKGNLAISGQTELEGIYTDELFADLYSKRGKPAQAAWRSSRSCSSPKSYQIVKL